MRKSKKCIKCGRRMKIDDYYKHSKMADGHLNACKPCVRAGSIANRAANVDRYREYDRRRYRTNPDRKSAALRSFSASSTPEMKSAHSILSAAVRDKRVEKPSACGRCGVDTPSKRLHGHHHDYTKPLDVEWVCVVCHRREHNKRRF